MTKLTAFLSALPLTLWLALGGAVALVSGIGWYNHTQREIGRRDAALASTEAAVARLSKSLDSTRKVFVIDTVRLTKRIKSTDTLVQHAIDTAFVHQTDTVKVTVEVLKDIQGTIKACQVTVADCTKLAQLERARADTLARQVALLKGERPGFWSRCGVSVGAAAVLAKPAGTIATGLGVLAGCRLVP